MKLCDFVSKVAVAFYPKHHKQTNKHKQRDTDTERKREKERYTSNLRVFARLEENVLVWRHKAQSLWVLAGGNLCRVATHQVKTNKQTKKKKAARDVETDWGTGVLHAVEPVLLF